MCYSFVSNSEHKEFWITPIVHLAQHPVSHCVQPSAPEGPQAGALRPKLSFFMPPPPPAASF